MSSCNLCIKKSMAKSPTNEFKKKYGNEYNKVAIEHPEIVAEYLYKYQDEGRFDSNPRLLVVYLDDNIETDRIEEIIEYTNIEIPLNINFTYRHSKTEEKVYNTDCFVILLYNRKN